MVLDWLNDLIDWLVKHANWLISQFYIGMIDEISNCLHYIFILADHLDQTDHDCRYIWSATWSLFWVRGKPNIQLF